MAEPSLVADCAVTLHLYYDYSCTGQKDIQALHPQILQPTTTTTTITTTHRPCLTSPGFCRSMLSPCQYRNVAERG